MGETRWDRVWEGVGCAWEQSTECAQGERVEAGCGKEGQALSSGGSCKGCQPQRWGCWRRVGFMSTGAGCENMAQGVEACGRVWEHRQGSGQGV